VTDIVRDVDGVLDLLGGETGLRLRPPVCDDGLLIGVSSGTAVARRAAGGRVHVARTPALAEPRTLMSSARPDGPGTSSS
jgi:hypothetical protein